MSLDDVASRTRIPIRHLQNIEREEWDALPAVTYAIGFTRNYANAVGLDGATLARELRERDRRPEPPRRRARILCPGRSGAGAAQIAGGHRDRHRRRADRRLSAVAAHARCDEPAPIPVAEAPAPQPQRRRRAAPPPAGRRRPAGDAGRDRRGLAADHRRAGRPGPLHGQHGRRRPLPAPGDRPAPADPHRPAAKSARRCSANARPRPARAPSEQVIENVSLRPEDLAAAPLSAPPPPRNSFVA